MRRPQRDSSTSTSSSSLSSSPKWISSLPALTRAGSPVSRSTAPRARSESAGSIAGADRGRRAAPPSWAALSAARTDIPSRTIRFASFFRASWSGQREDSAGVALRQLAARDHPEHLLGQLEQPQPVRHRRLRAADSFGDVAERELELVHERGVGPCLLDRRELLSRDVLDESEQERVTVVGLTDERGEQHDPGLAGRTPAALAGDQLVASGRARAHDDRLQQALLLDRACKAGRRLRLEAAARLPRVGVDRVDRQLRELGDRGSPHRRSEPRDRGPGRV